jgi:hypothetical protein
MFANAYGWPVIKHLCDTHFSDSIAALTPDDEESNEERAKEGNEGPDKSGGETNDAETAVIKPLSRSDRTQSEISEATDEVPELIQSPKPEALRKALEQEEKEARPTTARTGTDPESWDERYWSDSADETEDDDDDGADDPKHNPEAAAAHERSASWSWTEVIAGKGAVHSPKGTSASEIDRFLKNAIPSALSNGTDSHNAAESSNKGAASSNPDAAKESDKKRPEQRPEG